MEFSEALLTHLMALEKSLHSPLVRKSLAKLERLLHAEFKEVSRSGIYLRKLEVMIAFEQATKLPTIHSG